MSEPATSAMVTRCPQCSTCFRVTTEQLKTAKGAVRCGSCLHIFKALDHLLTLTENTDTTPASSQQTSNPPQTTTSRFTLIADEESEESTRPERLDFDQTAIDKANESDPLEDDDLLISDDMDQKEGDKKDLFDTDFSDSFLELDNWQPEAKSLFDRELKNQNLSDNERDNTDESWAEELLQELERENQESETSDVDSETNGAIDADSGMLSEEAIEAVLGEPLRDANEPSLGELDLQALELDEPSDKSLDSNATSDQEADHANREGVEPQRDNPGETGGEEPSAWDKEPSAPGEEPSALDEEPSALDEEPSALDEEPSALGEEPSALDEEFSALREEPSAWDEKPSARDEKPSASGKEPPIPYTTTETGPVTPSATSAYLSNIEPEPVEMDYRAGPSNWPRKLLWSSLSLLAGLGILLQLAWFQYDHYARLEPYRSWYALVCPIAGCQLPPLVDRSQISAYNLVIRSHPRAEKALIIDAILLNKAPFRQPFPKLALTFSNLQENPVASRVFKPEEYLRGELVGKRWMPSGQPVHLSLEVVDPGPDAVNYRAYIP